MFLKNYWYAAGFPDEFGRHLKARRFLDQNVVIFRDQAGEPVALEDRCAHRRLPLSMGRLIGDQVQCMYHGLVYDCSGACVHVPGQKAPPKGSGVRRFPILDRHGLTWIWMGEPELADPTLLPDYSRIDDPDWGRSRIQFHVATHYQLILDNLLDLSHLAYVHNTTTGNDSAAEDVTVRVETFDDCVQVKRWAERVPAAPTFRQFAGYEGDMDAWQISEFRPPSYMRVSYGSAPPGSGIPEGEGIWSQGHWGFQVLHGITPESERTTHHFRYVVHSFGHADEAVMQEFYRQCDQIIGEDMAVFPIQQRSIDSDPDASAWDINSSVTTVHDGGLMQARRIVAKLLAEGGEGRRSRSQGRRPVKAG